MSSVDARRLAELPHSARRAALLSLQAALERARGASPAGAADADPDRPVLVLLCLAQSAAAVGVSVESVERLAVARRFRPVFVLDGPHFAVVRGSGAHVDYVMPRRMWGQARSAGAYEDYLHDRLRAIVEAWGADGVVPLPVSGVADVDEAGLATLALNVGWA